MTEEELLDAVREALAQSAAQDSIGLTTRELADALGISQRHALAVIRDMVGKGTVEGFRGRRRNILGEYTMVPLYRLRK